MPGHDGAMDPVANGAKEKLARWTFAKQGRVASIS
jgi:hypothetical protein